jgi:1-pyrroline-5-carboxylate dehydrogenase
MKHYASGSPERRDLQDAIKKLESKVPLRIPLSISGKEINTDSTSTQGNPSSHSSPIAEYSRASANEVKHAIEGALAVRGAWASTPFADRCAIFLKAADLLCTKYRYEVMAATMLGQGKNAWQAEIEAAAELADFFRFNVKHAEELYNEQPPLNSEGVWNRMEYRPLEGFVYAVSPFNFTAIGPNLAGSPALMGNVVLWKPSDHAVASSHLVYKILLEAGLPEGVIQFVPGDAVEITKTVLEHPEFSSLHFVGSTAVFRDLYKQIGDGVGQGRYKNYPRIVGETGGKNFHLLHQSADIDNAVFHTIRGAFEYSGQKCSATSRVYVPSSIADKFKTRLVQEVEKLKVGPAHDFTNFMGPVIHQQSYEKLVKVIESAKSDKDLTLLTGGKHDASQGWFVHPTVYEVADPMHHNMKTEFFGPILHLYTYDDSVPNGFEKACKLADTTTQYGLTGSVFAQDRTAIQYAENALRHSSGMFYINGKSTGAVVGQQPFGGSRASGTNDKAGSKELLSRFVTMRTIKEDFLPIRQAIYPSNEA